MPTMNVRLDSDLFNFVEEELTRGEYTSASKIVQDALRLLRRETAAERGKFEILTHEIRSALKNADAGRFSSRTVMDIAEVVIQE
ncbi:ribbon-helix-helix domain-containing protein [Microvirga massiliensis]|uniref:ribbon-helix-helix domain-containing protein n=1 Tax=Microvirga massiliensis TaxID=1033741 RepID=UPI00062BDE3E|nr:type II toxin-antitoxin system ParD family antitoxin [Microvirga massiliensis]